MKIPIVVIVGRPNVGKSTLFNRLIGKREAIVDNVSGVTRDRNYGEVEWCGKFFDLIDTGGFVPNSKDLFEKAISEQIEFAIDEADSIIFLVDGNDGVTPVDLDIANQLRLSNKPVHLIVNKIDTNPKELDSSQFYELSLGDPFTISAQFGRKIGDFLDILTKEFPSNEDLAASKKGIPRIAIVGRPNVGKSSLVNALLGVDRNIVTNIPGTTRDSVDSLLKYQKHDLILIDTAGLRKKSKITENIEFYSVLRSLRAIEESDIVILMIDATIGLDKQDLSIIDIATKRKKGMIIAINKWDLIEKDSKTSKKFEDFLYDKIGEFKFIPVIFISCVTKTRVFKLIDLSLQIMTERSKKIPTNELNNFLINLFRNISLPTTNTGKEVKIKYATQMKTNPPVFAFFSNDPKNINENTKKFLEKKIREQFGFAGVPLTIVYKNK